MDLNGGIVSRCRGRTLRRSGGSHSTVGGSLASVGPGVCVRRCARTVRSGTAAWDLADSRDEPRCIDLGPLVLYRTTPEIDEPRLGSKRFGRPIITNALGNHEQIDPTMWRNQPVPGHVVSVLRDHQSWRLEEECLRDRGSRPVAENSPPAVRSSLLFGSPLLPNQRMACRARFQPARRYQSLRVEAQRQAGRPTTPTPLVAQETRSA